MKRRFGLLIVAVACMVFSLAAGATAAGPPSHFTDTDDYAWDDPGNLPSDCGSFDDLYIGHLDVSGMTKFDKAGNPVQDVVHLTGWEINWRSDRPDVTFTAKRSFTVIYDYATNTEKDVGIIYSATAPGKGLLMHDVGSIGFDDTTGEFTFIHGPHDVAEQGDAAFCNALLAIS